MNSSDDSSCNHIISLTNEVQSYLIALIGRFNIVYLTVQLGVTTSSLRRWAAGYPTIYSNNADNIQALYIEELQNPTVEAETIDIVEPASIERENVNPEPKPETDITELLPIAEQNGIDTVNGRDLHKWLGSKEDYSTWIKGRIDKYGFVENVDFIKVHQKIELSSTGQSGYEYYLSLDTSKELAMVQNNEKGREARRYFIKMEKKALEQPQQQYTIPETFGDALRFAANAIDKNNQAQLENEQIRFERDKVKIERDAANRQRDKIQIEYNKDAHHRRVDALFAENKALIESKAALNPERIGKLLDPPASARKVNKALIELGKQDHLTGEQQKRIERIEGVDYVFITAFELIDIECGVISLHRFGNRGIRESNYWIPKASFILQLTIHINGPSNTQNPGSS